jgi:hypothetical protein
VCSGTNAIGLRTNPRSAVPRSAPSSTICAAMRTTSRSVITPTGRPPSSAMTNVALSRASNSIASETGALLSMRGT